MGKLIQKLSSRQLDSKPEPLSHSSQRGTAQQRFGIAGTRQLSVDASRLSTTDNKAGVRGSSALLGFGGRSIFPVASPSDVISTVNVRYTETILGWGGYVISPLAFVGPTEVPVLDFLESLKWSRIGSNKWSTTAATRYMISQAQTIPVEQDFWL